MDVILKPIGWLMRQCYELTHHYALALLLFSFIIQLVIMLPLGIKQQKNTLKQAQLRPKELAIRRKYKGRNDKATQMKMQQEIQEMYQAEGFNQFAGCLPLLIQLPLVMILYGIIIAPITYLLDLENAKSIVESITSSMVSAGVAKEGAVVYEASMIKYLMDIGSEAATTQISGITADVYRSITELGSGFSFIGGSTLLDVPSLSFNWLLTIPVLVYVTGVGTTLVSQRYALTQEGMNNPMSGPMMKFGMPLISVFFAFSLSAAIGIYWVFRSIFTMAQTYFINLAMPIPKLTQEQIAAAEAALKKKKKKKKVLLIEVDEDDDSFDSLVVSEERAARIRAKNEKLAREEAEEDKKLEELISRKPEQEDQAKKSDRSGAEAVKDSSADKDLSAEKKENGTTDEGSNKDG